MRRQRLGHYIGRPGTTMERFSFGGPNDTFNQREQRTCTIGDTLTWTATRTRCAWAASSAQRVRHQPAGGTGDRVREVRQLHAAAARPGHRSRHAVRHHRQAVPVQRLQPVPRRRLAALADADAQPRRALRVLRLPEEVDGPHRQRRLRGADQHREPGERVHRAEERPEHRLRAIDSAIAASIKGGQQPHAEGAGLEQRRAPRRLCLDARRRANAGSCAAATASSTTGRRRRSSTRCSATTRSCASSEVTFPAAPCR